MITAIDALALGVPLSDLPPHLVQAPGVSAGAVHLASIDGMDVGVWEHSAGVSTDTEASEVFVVVSGRGRVICEQGGVIDLAPGVVGYLEAGAHTRWEIDEPVRKVWISRSVDTAQ